MTMSSKEIVEIYHLVHGDWQVRIKIGVQSFDVGPSRGDKREADWFASQLCLALDKFRYASIEVPSKMEPIKVWRAWFGGRYLYGEDAEHRLGEPLLALPVENFTSIMTEIERLLDIISVAERLNHDDRVERPQPHHPLWAIVAGNRAYMKEQADEINRLKEIISKASQDYANGYRDAKKTFESACDSYMDTLNSMDPMDVAKGIGAHDCREAISGSLPHASSGEEMGERPGEQDGTQPS